MRRLTGVLLFFLFVPNLIAQTNEEFRATWVITWEHINEDDSIEESKARVREIMDNHVKANMNAVLWQVRQGGMAYYNSSFEGWGRHAGYQSPGYDQLAYAVEQAHARGLELHAWMNVFESSSTDAGSAAGNNPDWVARDGYGNPMPKFRALSPGLPEVRAYLVDVAMEIVRNYDIDGLHLDYIRWNEWSRSNINSAGKAAAGGEDDPGFILSDAQIEELMSADIRERYLFDKDHPYSAGVPQGYDTWEDWWRSSVTDFVRTVQDSIKAIKPWVRLSPAAIGRYNWGGWNGYNVVFQDAALWFNEGYIDQIMGMHYHWFTGDEFYSMLKAGCPSCWESWIQPGLAAGRLFTVGPYSSEMARVKIWNRHPDIVARSRDVPWVDGFQFFSYGAWRDQRYWDEAERTLFPGKARVRPIGDRGQTPEAPSLSLEKIDSLNYRITIEPPAGLAQDHRFAIYRSEDDVPDTQTDEIVHIAFGRETFSFDDTFDGSQDYNGRYTYFATTLDRYWNESAVSGSAQGDPLPSFAPSVVSTQPAGGDSITVNDAVVLTFLKTMDTATFSDAVQFSPPVPSITQKWSADNKTLTVLPADGFEFATEYTLTIPATVTDINGVTLDGNSDGIPGDDFSLNFRTISADITGPVLLSSYPAADGSTTAFDVRDVISVVFDELVVPASVTQAHISLQQSGAELPANSFSYRLTDVNNKTVLGIQATEAFDMDSDYTLTIRAGITDTLGNAMSEDIIIPFRTAPLRYSEMITIDDFFTPGDWWQPNGSGSTVGIIVPNTRFGFSSEVFVPGVTPRRSAYLMYEWDTSAASHLLREYLAGKAPREVWFDSTYTLQVYIFGDGSNNKFRFALDDGRSGTAVAHEVSQWITIDWLGWKLVEWPLNDPNSVGSWLGNRKLDGGDLRIDSFQMTTADGAATSGMIYLDELRVVKKTPLPVSVAAGEQSPLPKEFRLFQNYPNPFNPGTAIRFDLPEAGNVVLKIFNSMGQEVATLVDGYLQPGSHVVSFEASHLSSGIYYYRLFSQGRILSKRMTLLK